jgi:hypothetical protein
MDSFSRLRVSRSSPTQQTWNDNRGDTFKTRQRLHNETREQDVETREQDVAGIQ